MHALGVLTASAAVLILSLTAACGPTEPQTGQQPAAPPSVSKECRQRSGDPTTCPPPFSTEPAKLPVGDQGAMVALGDSFSSGEGAPQVLSVRQYLPDHRAEVWGQHDYFYDGSDTPNNRCHRSPMAYAPQVASSLRLTLDFRACSGAKVPDFYYHQSLRDGERELGQQEGPWPADVKLVTAGFGGNDMGFADVVQSCLANGYLKSVGQPAKFSCAKKVDAVLDAADANDDAEVDVTKTSRPDYYFPVRLTPPDEQQRDYAGNAMGTTFADALIIAHEKAPEARLIVVSYPLMFPKEPRRRCGIGSGAGAKLSISDQTHINSLVAEINKRARRSAALAGADFVDMADAFEGHGLCVDDGNKRWVNRIQLGKPVIKGKGQPIQTYFPDLKESVHPNTRGQAAYAEKVLTCYDQPQTCSPVDWGKLAFREAKCLDVNVVSQSVYDSYLDAVRVRWHDFTGDGVAEAVVMMECPSTTSSWADEVLVYSGSKPGQREPDIIARLPDTDPAKAWLLSSKVTFDGPAITIQGVAVTPGHTPAEPVHWLTQTYHWQPEKFVLDNESLVARGWKEKRDHPKPGTYYGLFKQLDGQDLTIDQVAFFSGPKEAGRACREDGVEPAGPWCYDYYYRNKNSLITMGTVRADATVVYYDDGLNPVTTNGSNLAKLAKSGHVGDGFSIFRFDLDGDMVTAITQIPLS